MTTSQEYVSSGNYTISVETDLESAQITCSTGQCAQGTDTISVSFDAAKIRSHNILVPDSWRLFTVTILGDLGVPDTVTISVERDGIEISSTMFVPEYREVSCGCEGRGIAHKVVYPNTITLQ
jgi:hypothetical protein